MTDKEFVQALVGEELAQYEADAILKSIEILKSENAELRERLERSIELPFFQEDGEARILVYRDKNGIVCTEIYFEDEIYWGRRGDEAAEARFEEIRKDD